MPALKGWVQDYHPIAYASKSLTHIQQHYAQIEKEMLTVVFGCTRFYDYIYGVPNITVESDHKPLETILKKPLCQAPLQLQRMIMIIQKYYYYSLNLVYHPGKELVLADTLSRAFLQDDDDPLEENFEVNTLSKIVHKELGQRQKYYYDRHSKPLEEFTTGDQVMMKDKDRWRPVTVITKTAPQSYIIKMTTGQIY